MRSPSYTDTELVDAYTGGTLRHSITAANVNEGSDYEALIEAQSSVTGTPRAVLGDKAYANRRIMGFNTEHGIIGAFPLRATNARTAVR